MSLPSDLPITPVLPELLAALQRGGNAVLQAPPGAGKTTLVPLALLQAPWLTGKVIVLEPRRLAARAAARRISRAPGRKASTSPGCSSSAWRTAAATDSASLPCAGGPR